MKQNIDTFARVMSFSVTNYLDSMAFYDVHKYDKVTHGKSLVYPGVL